MYDQQHANLNTPMPSDYLIMHGASIHSQLQAHNGKNIHLCWKESIKHQKKLHHIFMYFICFSICLSFSLHLNFGLGCVICHGILSQYLSEKFNQTDHQQGFWQS
jgi:hypothetical protein